MHWLFLLTICVAMWPPKTSLQFMPSHSITAAARSNEQHQHQAA
jgi:hypothetical protein